jgi:hypothetical protein
MAPQEISRRMEEWQSLQKLLNDWREGASSDWIAAVEHEIAKALAAYLRTLTALPRPSTRARPTA